MFAGLDELATSAGVTHSNWPVHFHAVSGNWPIILPRPKEVAKLANILPVRTKQILVITPLIFPNL